MAYHSQVPTYSARQINEAQFLDLLKREWEPGHHLGIAAPTRWGKTWLMSSILQLRRYVAVYAMKQEDKTIKRFTGFTVVDSWRDRLYWQTHVVVWPRDNKLNPEELEGLKLKEGRYLADSIFKERKWTFGIDDLNDACAIGLKKKLSSMLRLCGSQGTSMVINYQRPFDIMQEALNQTAWTLASYQKDKRNVERLAEANGLSIQEALALNRQLTRYDFLVFRSMEEPIIVRRSGTS